MRKAIVAGIVFFIGSIVVILFQPWPIIVRACFAGLCSSAILILVMMANFQKAKDKIPEL